MKQSAMKLVNFYAPHALDDIVAEDAKSTTGSKANKYRNIILEYYEDKPEYSEVIKQLKKDLKRDS